MDFTSAGMSVSVKDLDPILRKYGSMIDSTIDNQQMLSDMVPYVRSLFKRNFESEGRRRGGQWAHLKEDTIKRKARLVAFAAGARGVSRGAPFRRDYSKPGGVITRHEGGRFGTAFNPMKEGVAKHVYEPVRLTDRLFNAAVGHTADSYLAISPNRLEIGVQNIIYANLQRFGGGRNVPARDYLMLAPEDKIQLMREIEDYIYTSFTAAGSIEGARRRRGFGGYVY